MTLNYGELLKAKRKEYVQAESAGTLRLANIGGATVKSRFTDAGESNNGIMGSRRKVQADPDQDDFLTQYFKNVYASNLTLQEQLSNSEEGSSTSAMMGPDNKPLDILNKGDDINIKIDSESNEGIENFYADLSMSESSSDSKKRRVNKDGTEYAGELQFGNDRLMDYMRATGAAFEMDEFVDDPLLQKEVGAWHIRDIDKQIAKIKNIPDKFSDRNGLRAVAHLGGITGMKKFISSGGEYNKEDELGTNLMKYYIKFSSKVGNK
jgi:hypothetical protein|tara:strand:+ start:188 stop:982 length:795 start_codon:yes stop_codon:yes gene_type:complete